MRLKFLSGLILISISTNLAWSQEKPVLTLDDCLKIALDENPTVMVSDLEIKRMDYSKKEIIGQLLPTVDFGANYNRMVAKQVMYLNMGNMGGLGGSQDSEGDDSSSSGSSSTPSEGIKMGLDNSYSLGFQVGLPIIAPQLWKTISVSDSQILRSKEVAMQSKQNLVNQVKSAFYAHLLAEDSRKVIQESYDMAKLTYEIYSKQYAVGAASDYDVLRTSVAMKNVEPQLLQADIAIKQTRLQLLILMGLDSSFDFTVSDQLSNYEGTMYESALSALSHGYMGNADLKIMDIDENLLQKNLSIEKLAYSPTLAFTFNYNWTSMSNGSPFKNFRWNPYSTVGLTLAVPIFSGGQKLNRIRQTKIQIEELKLQRENLERSISMQIDLAIDNLKVNLKQITSTSESVKQAERAHDIMSKSFDIGAASYLDLRDSELALTQARLAYYQAIYNYLVAESELELLQGTAPIEKYQ